jgi:hypothetical protein
MKNYFKDNNYGIRFKSKTEAIEQLCLKVFGATPVYESSLHDLEEETLESMYAKVVSVALDCDPIPAKDRADGKLEPPWEVFARVKSERDMLAEELKNLKSQLTQTQGAVTISRNGYVQELEQQRDEARAVLVYEQGGIHTTAGGWAAKYAEAIEQRDKWEKTARLYFQNSDHHREMREKAERERDRLAEALREIANEDYRGYRPQSANIAHKALAAVKENQKTDSQSCPECDALASYGSNDGPCETHKL